MSSLQLITFPVGVLPHCKGIYIASFRVLYLPVCVTRTSGAHPKALCAAASSDALIFLPVNCERTCLSFWVHRGNGGKTLDNSQHLSDFFSLSALQKGWVPARVKAEAVL